MMKRFILVVVFSILSLSIYAHDLFIEEENNNYKLLYGHKHSSHTGDSIIEYKPEFVKYIKCFKDGKIADVNFEKKYPVNFSKDCDAIYVIFSSGYWTKTVYGTKNVSKENEKQVIKSWLSFESVKYIKNLNAKIDRPLSEDLEIVVLSDLSKIKKGDKLRLRIFYKGKPKNDVIVAYDGKPRGTTGPEGDINIRVKNSGFQLISASITEKGDGIKADEKIITTSLNLIIKE